MKRKVEYNMEKRTKIAIIMVLFALVCFGISGYYIAQAIEAPNLANSQETEEIPEETNDITNAETATAVTTGISLADVSAEDTKTTTAKTLEVQFATVNVSGVTEPQEEESEPEEEVQELTDTAEIETTETQEETNTDEKIYAFNGVELSQSDFLLLKKTTYAEAGICDETTQRAVAGTILARAAENGQTISEVVFAPGQFSCAIGGQVYLVTSNGNIEVTQEMAEKTATAVMTAITDGSGLASGLGGEPLFFYSAGGLSAEELAKRSTISNSITLDRMTFYRVWD